MTRKDTERAAEKPVHASEGSRRNRREDGVGVSGVTAAREHSGPACEVTMEAVIERSNMEAAYARVMRNKGAAGVDNMPVQALKAHLNERWPRIKDQLLEGRYEPQPVLGVEIPKPGGGVRQLGITTVTNRLIQQAMHQVMSPVFEAGFSESSYGFRPGRGTHQAVLKAREYVAEGRRWVVDMDLEKFFDRVNHDVLMSRVARRVADKRLLKLIRAFLNSGVLIDGLFSGTPEGTPQGGPLSPLLSNLLLDDLDRELESRGLRFSRYADDCNIYVKSKRAGERVLQSVTTWLTKKLRLKVNQSKSAVDRPWKRKFLGFTFTTRRKRSIAAQSRAKFRKRVREITKRNRGSSLARVISELRSYVIGWRGYFGFCQTPSVLRDLDSWIHRRLRSYVWKQWKTGKRRFLELRQLGVGKELSAQTAGSRKGVWHTSRSPALNFALPGRVLAELGVPLLLATPEPKV